MPKASPYSSGKGSGGTAPRARASHSTASPRAAGKLVRLNTREYRLIHDTNRRVERLGRLDDRFQIGLRANPLADAFETCADLPAGIVEGC